MKHDGIEIPTHEQVAQVLDGTHPEVAEFIRGVNTDYNCWGDMLFMVQRDFPPLAVARAIQHLNMRGWGLFIAETFCPFEKELALLFEKAKVEETKISRLKFWERVKYFVNLRREQMNTSGFGCSLLPADALTRYKQTRQRWMKERNLLSYRDPRFIDEIVKYLREKGENKCDE